MRMAICVATGFLGLAFSSVAVAEGIPSNNRLAQLGLSSMEVSADEAGKEVRGRAFGSFSITFTLTVADGLGMTNTTGPVTFSHSYGHGAPPPLTGNPVTSPEPQPLGATAFGGIGFGTFANPANPNFNTFNSMPTPISIGVGPNLATASIQGFMFSIGR